MKTIRLHTLFVVLIIGLLTGCQSVPAGQGMALNNTSAGMDLEGNEVKNSNVDADKIQPAIQVEEPLRFTFPSPDPPPVSVWRPPLYDIPWALNENDHFYFSRPIAADEVNWPLADYRYGDFFTGTDIVHTGIDIDAKRGTPVLSAGSGEVIWAGEGLYRGKDDPDDPYGLAVAIRHDFGYNQKRLYTIYAHMDRVDVEVGQRVERGDPLGIVGNTGNTTGPHLHFEVRLENNSYYVSRNPELWLTPPQGWGVLVGRLMKFDATTISRLDVTVQSLDTQQTWGVRTYAPNSVNSDDYYRENLVLSDLPAGDYTLSFTYEDEYHEHTLTIQPGAITYFSFREEFGFKDALPAVQQESPIWAPVGN